MHAPILAKKTRLACPDQPGEIKAKEQICVTFAANMNKIKFRKWFNVNFLKITNRTKRFNQNSF
jgi:hypothetical protein